MTTVKDRLITFINSIGVDRATFERQCGLSNGFLNNTNDNIRRKSVNAIKSAYPIINEEWLLKGTGEMIIESDSTPDNSATISADKLIEEYRATINELREDKKELRLEICRLKEEVKRLQDLSEGNLF